MQIKFRFLSFCLGCVYVFIVSCHLDHGESVTVPFTLDHNRMLVDAEIRRADGTWREARLWVDTGNPEFFISEELASDLGIDQTSGEVTPPAAVRIGGKGLNFEGVSSRILSQPKWLFSTMHNDANLPSTVLRHYRIVFDYPKRRLTLADPGSRAPRGIRAPASVHPETGIIQIDAVVGGDSVSFALDNGASYSFMSGNRLEQLSQNHPGWRRMEGAVGCANIWGWWPGEKMWPVVRIPDILWGSVPLTGVGMVGLPDFFPDGADLGAWYSQKSARPVAGFLGSNAFKSYRIEIDFTNEAVYFEKGGKDASDDMVLVGLTLRPEADGGYRVIGVSSREKENMKPGDLLIRVDDVDVTGATMGTVVDALRGEPGEMRTLVVERDGRQLTAEARVERLL